MMETLLVHDFKEHAMRENKSRFLRLPEVMTRTGLSRTTIYRKVARSEFPRPVHISERVTGWLDTDITAWMDDRVQSSGDEL
jgi:prophage regulatory protein